MKYIHRVLEKRFDHMGTRFKAILLTGARQVGKTTMLRHLCEGTDRKFVSLDDPLMRSSARNDPRAFLQEYAPPVLIDEVQYAPELFPYIKIACDNSTDRNLFWLTGSQHYEILKNVHESLAGRIGLLEMYSLSQEEMDQVPDEPALRFEMNALKARAAKRTALNAAQVFARIWTGGMPDVQGADQNDWMDYFDAYVETYLLRDVADYGSVQNMERFRTFLRACAGLCAQQTNYATLAETVGISEPTARTWLELLVGLGIVYPLTPYYRNDLKRLAKRPKLYFCDTGLAAYLAQWTSPETLRYGAASGSFFENYVVMELVKSLSAKEPAAKLHYFRQNSRTEIDVLVELDRVFHPLEIKQSASPSADEVKKFQILDEAHEMRGRGGIICTIEKPIAIDAANAFIPSYIL